MKKKPNASRTAAESASSAALRGLARLLAFSNDPALMPRRAKAIPLGTEKRDSGS